jgi:septal ring factor EnvC (AmiA/AmiB activator)
MNTGNLLGWWRRVAVGALVVCLTLVSGGCGRSQVKSEITRVQQQIEKSKSVSEMKSGEHRVLVSEIATLEGKHVRPSEVTDLENTIKETEAEIASLQARATELEKANEAGRKELESYRSQYLKN